MIYENCLLNVHQHYNDYENGLWKCPSAVHDLWNVRLKYMIYENGPSEVNGYENAHLKYMIYENVHL